VGLCVCVGAGGGDGGVVAYYFSPFNKIAETIIARGGGVWWVWWVGKTLGSVGSAFCFFFFFLFVILASYK